MEKPVKSFPIVSLKTANNCIERDNLTLIYRYCVHSCPVLLLLLPHIV